MDDFAHLHLHTLYSLLDGAIRLPDLMKSCAASGMKSVAVTDHGNMFGVVSFYQEAKKAGIKPIIGFEAYVAGEKGMTDKSQREASELKEIFADRLYLEIQSNALKEQLPVNHGLCELSRELSIPLVATADSHYVRREDAKAHEVLMAIASGRTFDDPKRLRHETEELYIKSPQEMYDALEAVTGVGAEWKEAVHNSWLIAERCNVELNLKDKFLPKFQVPEGETLDSYIQRRAREGLDERFAEIARTGRRIDV